VHYYLPVQVRRRHQARSSHRADGLALSHPLALGDQDLRQVVIAAEDAGPVVNDHAAAPQVQLAGEGHPPTVGRHHRRAFSRQDVDACVVAEGPAVEAPTHAEGVPYLAHSRQDERPRP
jgi:hypothetical protein